MVADEFPLPEWDVQQFLDLLLEALDKAAGLDGWAPKHWTHLSVAAAKWLLVHFALVENGAPWPKGLRKGKPVFIAKPSTSWEDPLTFRILLILPYAYRCGAKMRLRHLAPWIRSWATEDMFGLYEGTGAQGAWYRSAVVREEALLSARPFSGSCDDIWKAYDGISRELAVAVACVAGFPRKLARAYMAFHSGLVIHNGLAQGLGAPRCRARSIPQGCPWSNALLGLLLRPLMLQLRVIGTVPRLLADDLETMAFGPRHPALLRHARREVDRHLLVMGTRASTGKGKSHVFASAKAGRRRLRREMADAGRAVLFRWRGLGAHANVAKNAWVAHPQ